MFNDFYRGRRVLVTGHSGFKGSWLSLWLNQLGAEVWGLGLAPETQPNLHEVTRNGTFAGEIECDIRDFESLRAAVGRIRPEIIFHLAAQSLVRRSYAEPRETFATNAVGTVHLLEAVRLCGLPCAVVVVTSDKCYENVGWTYGYRENDRLGGRDVYSMSKAVAELAVQSWRECFFDTNSALGPVATVRAGNVIGGGDYSADRIVPDSVRALIEGRPIAVRNPTATRPWQHVLDCLSGYLWLGARLGRAGRESSLRSAFNFGPGIQSNVPVSELVGEILRSWPGRWENLAEKNAPHEAAQLNLATDKAAALLQWFPTWDFKETIRQTVAWYRERHVARNPDLRAFGCAQIAALARDAAVKKLAWAVGDAK